MNRFFTVFGVIILFAATSNGMGQSKKFELFGGYSVERDVWGDAPQGWNASLAAKVNPWLSVMTDFSGHYGGRFATHQFGLFTGWTRFMTHSAMVGPQVMMAHDRFRPFARALFGAARISYDSQSIIFPSGSHTGFAWPIGGGLDWKAFENTRIRLIQADYIRADEVGPEHEALRLSFGIVVPF